MGLLLRHPFEVASAVILITAILAYAVSGAFRFWVFHAAMNFPVIGRVPLFLGYINPPTGKAADARLDRVFLAYRTYIPDPPSDEDFKNASSYLFLAGDGGVKTKPRRLIVPLVFLLTAEAYGFSFLLATALAPNMSEQLATRLSGPVALLVALLLAYWGHNAGRSYHRAREIGLARREALDESSELPNDETPIADLKRLIPLSEDQDRDKAKYHAYNSQRLLNRILRTDTESPSHIWGVFFWICVIGLAGAQFKMRMANAAAVAATQAAADLVKAAIATAASQAVNPVASIPSPVGAQQEVTSLANVFLVAIFLATQGVAFLMGYRHTLLGVEGADALDITGGHSSIAEFEAAAEARIRRADATLRHLISKLQTRYPNAKFDDAKLYLERLWLAKEREHPPVDDDPTSPSDLKAGGATEAGSNVKQHPTALGGAK